MKTMDLEARVMEVVSLDLDGVDLEEMSSLIDYMRFNCRMSYEGCAKYIAELVPGFTIHDYEYLSRACDDKDIPEDC